MTSPDSPSPRTEAGTCWFCRREVPWATLIAGYDTWDEQRLACPSCDRSVRWLGDHGWNLSRAANEADAQSTFDRAKELVRAAQEAPAPEGLRAALVAAEHAAGVDSVSPCRHEFAATVLPECEWRADAVLASLARTGFRLAPPSPAEPPRPEFPHMAECRLLAGKGSHSFCVCGCHRVLVPTTGTGWASAATNYAPVRAEARPPEGLAEVLERIANRAHQGWLSENVEAEFRAIEAEARLAARLSARGTPE